jgi:hypothetical protein
VALIRLPYDRDRTIAEFQTTGYLEYSGPVAHLMLNELLEARPQMFSFTRDYQEKILSGVISVEAAVSEHLRIQGFEYPVAPENLK